MAVSLIKMVITATSTISGEVTTTTNTTVTPTGNRFVAFVTAGMVVGGVTTIPAANFADDSGTAVVNLPAIAGDSYVNLYVNGVLQQADLMTTLSTTQVVLGAALTESQPVMLEFINVTAASTSTSTNNLTVNTTINT
ncbi:MULTISPECIES: DUF4183 domain-containing protein [Bacillus]|uniref:DUF4183 domain-containing protein n=1 Tax=Bacillus TaxID=1386 RepID=UPI00089786F5|nr:MULTISPECIES: DUF4183 domain-containing protein [Bacillus]WIY62402.1 DUF4183 domain-containing protein [Bacillus arachidis]SDZ24732.1 protein of unknown function [Bacillus sp. 166amftsu]